MKRGELEMVTLSLDSGSASAAPEACFGAWLLMTRK